MISNKLAYSFHKHYQTPLDLELENTVMQEASLLKVVLVCNGPWLDVLKLSLYIFEPLLDVPSST